jgi:transcriptional regulator with XRE-family HTH domain
MTTHIPAPTGIELRRLAGEVRAEMARRDVNQSALARQVGEPVTTVHRWVKTGQGLTVERLLLLSRALEVEPAELMRRAEFRCTLPSMISPGSSQVMGILDSEIATSDHGQSVPI